MIKEDIIAFILAIPIIFAVWFIGSLLWSDYNSVPSEIIDYSPSVFIVKTNHKFFYSIDNELRYNNNFDHDTPVLFKANKGFSVYVSPSNTLAAIVSNGELRVVSNDGVINQLVTNVDGTSWKSGPIGKVFFRERHIQWSKDSTKLFLIKDEFYQKDQYASHSEKAELYQYQINDKSFKKLISPFKSYKYFFDDKGGVYYVVATEGDLVLKYFTSEVGSSFIDMSKVNEIKKENEIFYNFSRHDYKDALILKDTFREKISKDKEYLTFYVDELETLKLKRSHGGGKGYSYGVGINKLGNMFTPDKKYFLLNVSSGTFTGQLLIDMQSKKYMPLPKHTRMFQNMNTQNFKDWEIAKTGVFVPRKTGIMY